MVVPSCPPEMYISTNNGGVFFPNHYHLCESGKPDTNLTINYMKKELYLAPDTEVLELQVSSALLDASILNNGGNAFGERYDTDTI